MCERERERERKGVCVGGGCECVSEKMCVNKYLTELLMCTLTEAVSLPLFPWP